MIYIKNTGEDKLYQYRANGTVTANASCVARQIYLGGQFLQSPKEWNMIEKIEQTLDVVIPFVILVLSVLQLSGVITVIEEITPIIYGALSVVMAIFSIWGIAIRAKRGKAKS